MIDWHVHASTVVGSAWCVCVEQLTFNRSDYCSVAVSVYVCTQRILIIIIVQQHFDCGGRSVLASACAHVNNHANYIAINASDFLNLTNHRTTAATTTTAEWFSFYCIHCILFKLNLAQELWRATLTCDRNKSFPFCIGLDEWRVDKNAYKVDDRRTKKRRRKPLTFISV